MKQDFCKKGMIFGIILLLFGAGLVQGISRSNIEIDYNKEDAIIVDARGNGDFTSIQDAIEAANPGDTVYVYSGFYQENVRINKALILMGEDMETTIIDGGKKGSDVVRVYSDDVTISGFTIQNSDRQCDSGIHLKSSSHCTIRGNIVIKNDYGITLTASNNNNVTGNIVTENSRGLCIFSSYSNTIYNNYLDNSNNAFDNGNNTWNIYKTSGTNIIGGSYLGGNYWSCYTGKDIDGDGLGDTRIPHGPLNGDYLPLVNQPPNEPTTSYNRENGELIIYATDPEDHKIRYGVSWNNDGIIDYWTDFVDSGTELRIDCEGRKVTVGVIAEDEHGAQSNWVSQRLTNKLIQTHTLFSQFFENLLQNHPLLFPLLQRLLGLQ